jgi:hypothetical protein
MAVTPSAGLRARLTDALAGDAGAEGARWMLRAPAPRALLRQQLAAMLPAGQPLGPCKLRRAKFKPGRRLNAWYDVDLGPAGRRPIAVTWEDPPPSPDWPAADEMEAEAAAAGQATPFLHLRSTAPDLGLRVLVAPLDPAFGHLVRLSDPLRVPRLLAGAQVDADGGPWSATTVRYRPGQRHVLRWEQDGAQHRAVFAKPLESSASTGTITIASTNTSGDFQARNASVPVRTRMLPVRSLTDSVMNSSTSVTSLVTRVSTSPVRRWLWNASDSFSRWENSATRRL